MNFAFTSADLVESIVMGVALAMDAMAVTLSNSLAEPNMPRIKKIAMPVTFALFQIAMPVAGYFGGLSIASLIDKYSGIVSLVILAFVGGKMLIEAIQELRHPETAEPSKLTWGELFIEGIATAIDAFVVGVAFATANKNIVLYSGMIGVTTFCCCAFVLLLGRKLGERFGARAQVVGGLVLIAIGIKAFIGI